MIRYLKYLIPILSFAKVLLWSSGGPLAGPVSDEMGWGNGGDEIGWGNAGGDEIGWGNG